MPARNDSGGSAGQRPESTAPQRAGRPGWERFSPLRIMASAVVIFLFAPLLVVLITSFSNADTLSFPPEGFSLRWYGQVWGFLTNAPDFKEGMARSLLFSLLLGVGVCGINIVLGVPASYAIVRGRRWNAFLDIFVSMPLVVPLVVVGIAMLVLAKETGVSALPRVIMGHVVITLPSWSATVSPPCTACPTASRRRRRCSAPRACECSPESSCR